MRAVEQETPQFSEPEKQSSARRTGLNNLPWNDAHQETQDIDKPEIEIPPVDGGSLGLGMSDRDAVLDPDA